VNVIPVRLANGGKLESVELAGKLEPPKIPKGFASGYLVIRPESIRFVGTPDGAENVVTGRLYNEYALGSRIQYQIRSGEHVFLVEKLRQQAYAGKLDDEVFVGWDAKDSILVTD
jgi:spermidine/putrescine transport system ATP-binding protein